MVVVVVGGGWRWWQRSDVAAAATVATVGKLKAYVVVSPLVALKLLVPGRLAILIFLFPCIVAVPGGILQEEDHDAARTLILDPVHVGYRILYHRPPIAIVVTIGVGARPVEVPVGRAYGQLRHLIVIDLVDDRHGNTELGW